MPSKKSGKPVRKPAKAPAKKAVAKTVAAKKPARPVSKPSAKPARPAKAAAARPPAKPVAPRPIAARPIAARSVAAKQPHAKVAPRAAPAPAPVVTAPPVRPVPLLTAKPGISLRTAFLDEDADTDPGSPASLLAGPRNVKPYIPRRGEQYMNKEQLGHFARILLNWKRDLMVEVDRTVLHMKDEAANFPDPNDRATQEEEFSLELRTRDRERKLIRKIDEALKRIEDGNYGYCLETGEEIGIKRLEARPVATLSVEAQERRERREKQYGDRDDRYR
jgi:DnaK suppressor protein